MLPPDSAKSSRETMTRQSQDSVCQLSGNFSDCLHSVAFFCIAEMQKSGLHFSTFKTDLHKYFTSVEELKWSCLIWEQHKAVKRSHWKKHKKTYSLWIKIYSGANFENK